MCLDATAGSVGEVWKVQMLSGVIREMQERKGLLAPRGVDGLGPRAVGLWEVDGEGSWCVVMGNDPRSKP